MRKSPTQTVPQLFSTLAVAFHDRAELGDLGPEPDGQEQLANLEPVGRPLVDVDDIGVAEDVLFVHALGAYDLDVGERLALLVHVEGTVEVGFRDQLVGVLEDLRPLDHVLGERPPRDDQGQAGENENQEAHTEYRFSAHGHTSRPMEFHLAVL
jgi:hypothetical protein